MTSKTNVGLVEWCLRLIGQAYWWGCCVYDCTASLLKRKAEQYPRQYGESRMKRYKADIAAGKKCSDCIGIVKGYYWTRDDGVMQYGLDGRPDKGADGMFAAAKVKGVIATLPEIPGLLLFSPGHAGVYVGRGWAVEARGFDHGIVKTKVAERGWTHWYECPFIDYVNGDHLLEVNGLVDSNTGAALEAEMQAPAPEEARRAENEPAQVRLLKYTKGWKMLTGDDVKNVQQRLLAFGYDPGACDGVYGPFTCAAVKAFQSVVGIQVDGMVGPATRAALENGGV